MEEKHIGWYKMQRSILDGPVWVMGEAFDKRAAYIDMLLSANYEEKKFIPRHSNDVITIKIGQLMTSIEKLADRWKWNKRKVINYLNQLEKAGLILKKSYNFGTLLTLLEYSFEGDACTASDTASGTAKGTPVYTASDTRKCTRLKKDKKDKKETNKKNQEAAQRPKDCFCWEGDPE